MKKLVLLGLMILILAGCSTTLKDNATALNTPTIEGYITAAELGRYLVVSNEPIHLNDSHPQFVDALWVTTKEVLEVGDYVKVWAGAILTSYPGQAGADKIEIIPQNVNTILSTKEIIDSVAKKFDHNPIITNVNYDRQKQAWTLRYQVDAGGRDMLVGMVIPDQQPISLEQPIYEQPPNVAFAVNQEDHLSLYVQRYEWTYTDLTTDEEKHIEHELPSSNIQASFNEATTLKKPEQVKLIVDGLDILHSEISFFDEQMNEVAKIINEDGTFLIGTYYMQVKVQFEQGLAVYVDTVRFQ
ncbi:DUF3221 domain-containing protein [Lysinibacillus sp. NPDC096418]|uniref:DUF3221 domain-containing protein n=1 Tax=Lysinibacillus sp. NPDC096418 TaxID=3364138 RepID=UPI00381485A8